MATSKSSIALTIAGFDPSGGAGVLADMRTFAAFGLEAAAAITSITFQNASKVLGASHQSGDAVRGQVLPLLEESRIVCAKTGMLPTREVVLEVARLFRETDLPRPVVDPVILSSSGQRLMEDDALAALIEELLPLGQLITPNVPEAERLAGITITSEEDMRRAAVLIREKGAGAVLIKGGHLRRQEAEGRRREARESGQWAVGSRQWAKSEETDGPDEEAVDVLDNEGRVTVFRERRVSGGELHGSGCILSAAIAAGLGKGMTLEDSVGAAKSFVLEAIRFQRQGREM
jgi:hydroxymethylpyrimidine kinase/phosphomethylpyrimidine kinase